MADKGISFNASPSPDVVAYLVVLTEREPPNLEVGRKTYEAASLPTVDGQLRIDLAADSDWPNLDGLYYVEIRAIDDAGNQSSPLQGALELDKVAPDAPTEFNVF